jgi:phosphopentomutase
VGGLALPNLQALGLGNLTAIAGVREAAAPRAAWGVMREASAGKDTITGHWEMAGSSPRGDGDVSQRLPARDHGAAADAPRAAACSATSPRPAPRSSTSSARSTSPPAI